MGQPNDLPRPPAGFAARRFHLRDVGDVLLVCFPLDPSELRPLTAAERAVARLALTGASNAQIARAREASQRTVANQLASVFKKLGVSSRAELADRLAKVDFCDAEDAA